VGQVLTRNVLGHQRPVVCQPNDIEHTEDRRVSEGRQCPGLVTEAGQGIGRVAAVGAKQLQRNIRLDVTRTDHRGAVHIPKASRAKAILKPKASPDRSALLFIDSTHIATEYTLCEKRKGSG